MSGGRVRLGLLRRTGFEWRAGCLIDDLLTTSCFPLSSLTGYYFSTSPHTVPHSSSIMNSTRLSTADGRTLRFFSFFLFFFLFKHESWRRKSYLVSPRDGNANRATRWTFFMTYTAHWAGQLFSSGQHTAWHLSSWQLSKLVDDSVRLPPVSRDPKIMQHLKWWACPGDKSPRHIWLRFQKKTATDSYFNVISLAWIICRNWRPVKVETWRAWRIQ